MIHCYSGYENKVRKNLEQRIETMAMKDKIFDVVIPTQEEIEVRDGKRRTVEAMFSDCRQSALIWKIHGSLSETRDWLCWYG